MKNVILFLTFISSFFLSTESHAQWTQTGGPEGGFYCVTKAHRQIWGGAADGIYISRDQGYTWSKSSYINNYTCGCIYSEGGDTVVVLYHDFNIESFFGPEMVIVSFDGGSSWTAPDTLLNPTSDGNYIYRVQNALIYESSQGEQISYNFGQTWSPFQYPTTTESYTLESNTFLSLLEGYNSANQTTSYYLSSDGTHSYPLILHSPYSSYSNGHLHDSVVMVSTNYNFAVYKNSITRSTDLGHTWDTTFYCHHDTTLGLFDTHQDTDFVDASDTFGHSLYYYSTNHGLTWSGPDSGSHVQHYGLKMNLDSADLYMTNGWIYHQISGHLPLITMTGTKSLNAFSVFSIKGNLYATSYFYGIYRSTDAGQTWQMVMGMPDPDWWWTTDDLGYINRMINKGDTLFAAGGNTVGWSYDNGIHWTERKPASSGWFTGTIARANNRIIYSTQNMISSDDYGHTWDSMPHSLPNWTRIGSYGDDAFAYVLGDNILKYNLSTGSWDSIYHLSMTIGNNSSFQVIDSIFILFGNVTSGVGNGSIARSFDHGQTWSSHVWSPIIDNGLWSIASVNGTWVGIGDSAELYASTDSGVTWQLFQGIPPFATQQGHYEGLATLNGVLYTASNNSGVWKRNFYPIYPISGTVYQDLNNNGIRDAGEAGIPGMVVSISPSGSVAATDTGGHYILYTDCVGEVLSPALPLTYMHANPQSYMTTGTAATHQDFGVYTSHDVRDLSIDITSEGFLWNAPSGNLDIYVKNKGAVAQAGTVTLVLDSTMTYITSAVTPIHVSLNRDTIVWLTDTLGFLQTYNINASIYAPDSIGTYLYYYAQVDPITRDTFPSDNYYYGLDMVSSSFDPNSKECTQGPYFNPQAVADSVELIYIVRFENIGNAPASNIKISDTLSPLLDAGTFRIISSSYPATFDLSGTGIVDFHFDNIHLPTHAHDSTACNGFVKYGVRCKKSLVSGDAISNIANIYFDSNPAVVTNEVVTVISPLAPYTRDTLVTTGLHMVAENTARIFPNPNTGHFYVDLSQFHTDDLNIDIYDQLGRILLSQTAHNTIEQMNLPDIADGVYIVRIHSRGAQLGAFRFVLSK